MSRLDEALAQEISRQRAALAAFVLDDTVIEERGKEMVKPLDVRGTALYLAHVAEMDARDRARASGRLAYDTMPRHGRDDDRRRGRDEEPEREPLEELQELLTELEPEEQKIVS